MERRHTCLDYWHYAVHDHSTVYHSRKFNDLWRSTASDFFGVLLYINNIGRLYRMNCLCSINTHGFHKVNAVVAAGTVPLVLYSFSGSSGTSLLNNATAVFDGTMSNSSCISTAQDSTGSGNSFILTTSNYANCALSPTYPLTITVASGNGFTCCFWFKSSTYSLGVPINLITYNTVGSYFYIAGGASSTATIEWRNTSLWTTTGTTIHTNLFDGNWHFICGVCTYTNSTTATISLYFDNTLDKSISTTSIPTVNTAIRINTFNSGGSYNMSSGFVDNIRYYNIPLTTAQMTTLYSSHT